MTLDNKCSTHRSFLANYLFQLLTNLENFFLEIHCAQNTERLRQNKEARTQLHMALKRFAPHHGRLALSRVHDILAADRTGFGTTTPCTYHTMTHHTMAHHTMTQPPHNNPTTTQCTHQTMTHHTNSNSNSKSLLRLTLQREVSVLLQ